MDRGPFDASQGQGVHTQTLTLTGRPSSKTSGQLPTTNTSPRSLSNRAQITNTSPRSSIPNTSPRGTSGVANTSPRGSTGKLPSPRVLTDLQISGRQSNLGRSPSPKVYGHVTPLNLDMRSSPSNQLDRSHGSPGQIDMAEFEGVSNKQRLPPVLPTTRKKSGKQSTSPRQKSGGKSSPRHQALVPKSAGAMASLKAAQEALPIVKKDGMYFPKGYTMRPVIPAQKAELIDVARAMNREEFGPRVKKLFDPETQAATEAIKSGVYVGWRCPEFTWDCIRVGRMSRCFCGHLLQEHASYNGHSVRVPCKEGGCRCKAFAFIPGRPEDIGEFWHQRRRNFDPTTWRAKCRCKHSHEQHDVTGLRRCRTGGCGCGAFNSNFLCAACDRHWEDHETVFETETERIKKKIPCGQDYLPFAEMPNMRNMALTGVDDDPGIYTALMEGEGAIPRTNRAITQDSPFKPPSGSGFNPVWD